MTDVHKRSQRSYNMSRIRSKNTKPEVLLRKRLYNGRLTGYRLHYKLPGRPDVAYTSKKVAIFVDGCFWHRCPKCFVKPVTNVLFWKKKINANVRRDHKTDRILASMGWRTLRIREHEINHNLKNCYEKVKRSLKKANLGVN